MVTAIWFLVFSLFVQAPAWAAAPIGFFDGTTCSTTWGWTCDPDNNYGDFLEVHFYADGPTGTGAFIGSTTANASRPDVAEAGVCGGNASHGFSLPTTPLVQLGDTHTIYAYAIDPQGGPATLLTNSPRSLTCQRALVSPTYFGFALIGGRDARITGTDLQSTNQTETGPFTNIMEWIVEIAGDPGVPSTTSLAPQITAIRNTGAWAILRLEDLFFKAEGMVTKTIPQVGWTQSQTVTIEKRVLRSDWKQRWNKFIDFHKNRKYLNTKYISAFFIADEPAWHDIPLADVTTVVNTVSSTFPLIPTLIVENWIPLYLASPGQQFFPTSTSWIAFDWYGEPPDSSAYQAMLTTLRNARSNPNQKILLIGDLWWNPNSAHIPFVNHGYSAMSMAGVAVKYYDLARQSSDVIGLAAWAYTNDNGITYGPNTSMARELMGQTALVAPDPPLPSWVTNVIDKTYRLIGRSISGK